MKKIIAILLATLFIFSMSGCGNGSNPSGGGSGTRPPEQIAQDKTQLYVSNYNGGYGTEWLYAIKDRFEKDYAETVFQEGKKGVQIVIHADKDNYAGQALYNKMGVTSDEVFFAESVTFNDYVSSGYMLDISDIVTGENLDGKTIESKYSDEQKSALKIGGKYYCVPHYASFEGINYDIDLFDSEKLYYAKNGAPSEPGYTGNVKYTNLAGERSKGPDGEYGTYDDGLPATYDELFALCGYMKNNKGITPFCWTGLYRATYTRWIFAALATDYEGKEQMMLNYDFSGTAKNIVDHVDSNGNVVLKDPVDITNANGFELYRSAGRYYALKFFEQLLAGNYYDTFSFDDGVSGITAQDNYLRSSQKGEPIAMLLEGIWWENEATDSFAKMEKKYGEEWAMKTRRFGYMPFPKVSQAQIGQKSTLIDNHHSYAFINGRITAEKIDLAKLFLKYCYTDISLKEFTTVVGLPKALSYDMDANTEWKSTYSKNVWEFYKNSDRVYPISQNPMYLSSQADFVYPTTFATATQSSALDALYEGATAKSHFEGIISFRSQSSWESSYSRFFEN